MTGEPDAPPGAVLVVEDNALNRLTLVRGVEREGHRVIAVEDGQAALDVLRREPVDIVLLDLLMPVLDGFAVLDAMHHDPDLHDLPVLVISAVDEVDSIARAIEMGAIDVLPKPFDPVLLRARLRTATAQRRLRRLEQAYLSQELALRQHERLAALGRLSAGLAHELNNPAAAALRTAHRLEQHIARGAELLAAVPPEVASWSPPADTRAGPAGDVTDLEDDLADALSAADVDDPEALAAELAEAGVTPAQLDAVLADAGEDPDAAVAFVANTLGTRRSLDQLLRSVERIWGIVDALRGYTYLDRGPEQDVDVRRGLDDTLSVLGAAVAAGVTVRRDYAADLPTLRGRGGQLNQVWTNLIDNALDALAGTGTLTLRAAADDGNVVVQVEDDGPGIPADLLGSVFDAFVTSKEPGEGTGLGLNIAHQVVTREHDGQLLVESRPGRTVFTVRLPVTRSGRPHAG